MIKKKLQHVQEFAESGGKKNPRKKPWKKKLEKDNELRGLGIGANLSADRQPENKTTTFGSWDVLIDSFFFVWTLQNSSSSSCFSRTKTWVS
jgi:hypothetical protein